MTWWEWPFFIVGLWTTASVVVVFAISRVIRVLGK